MVVAWRCFFGVAGYEPVEDGVAVGGVSDVGPDEESFVYQFLQDDHVPADDVLSFGNTLIRVRNILQAQGRDY